MIRKLSSIYSKYYGNSDFYDSAYFSGVTLIAHFFIAAFSFHVIFGKISPNILIAYFE